MVSKDIPDLIIWIPLPKMDGHKVCETVKKRSQVFQDPDYHATAKDREEELSGKKNIGADAYISKTL